MFDFMGIGSVKMGLAYYVRFNGPPMFGFMAIGSVKKWDWPHYVLFDGPSSLIDARALANGRAQKQRSGY